MHLILVLGAAALLAASNAISDDRQPSEFELKAAFVLNLPKYVDWPSSAFVDSNSPIVITVLGPQRFRDRLGKLVEGRVINQRAMVVSRATREEDLVGPRHILFVAAAEEKRMPAILDRIKGSSVLTVGESDGFLNGGGMVNLAWKGRKVRLEIDLAPARAAGLKISSRLLSTAALVKGREN